MGVSPDSLLDPGPFNWLGEVSAFPDQSTQKFDVLALLSLEGFSAFSVDASRSFAAHDRSGCLFQRLFLPDFVDQAEPFALLAFFAFT